MAETKNNKGTENKGTDKKSFGQHIDAAGEKAKMIGGKAKKILKPLAYIVAGIGVGVVGDRLLNRSSGGDYVDADYEEVSDVDSTGGV